MPDDRNSLISERRQERVWAVLRRVAPATIGLGGLGTVVGLITGQEVGLVLLDVMVMIVGAVLLLILRWR